jgi:hypothetical protein
LRYRWLSFDAAVDESLAKLFVLDICEREHAGERFGDLTPAEAALMNRWADQDSSPQVGQVRRPARLSRSASSACFAAAAKVKTTKNRMTNQSFMR